MIYYTADLHFGHEVNIEKSARPFLTVQDMEVIFVRNWNNTVHEEDTVYIVGDFISRSKLPPAHYLEQLAGKKHLIVGNHDPAWMRQCDLSRYFESVDTFLEIQDEGRRVVLCHFPMVEWWGSRRGSFLIYGHVHGRKDQPTFSLLRQLKHAYNAGVDINHYKPVTFDELVKNHKAFYGV